MAVNIEESLWKYVPLLLFVLVSWIVSMVIRKIRPPDKEEEATETQKRPNPLLELFDQGSPEPPPGKQQAQPGAVTPRWIPDQGAPVPRSHYSGPVVTPEPIKPKWWGA